MVRNGGAVALGVAGVAFAAYPALRPYVDGPQVWAQPWWVPSHLLGVLGFALLVPGLVAVRQRLHGTTGERAARVAVVAAGTGAALVLPYYGAEAFALGRLTGPDAVAVGEAIRMDPWAVTTFAAGLLALAAAGVFAAALVLYLPQFFAAPGVRIAHGVLLAAGCLLLAAATRTRARPAPAPA
ncbi:hypothetical protein Ae263Ps1_1445c [Pseudonocardia sp. Ae263_Ps1]|uniref:hypothetical protein n=1 Tax=Pseudonocardia sp. Ae263_Ps1 TaxID=1885030 RepID=UPI00094B1B21|nr:hypothetical protein [Pseudonocardia sp. Ae263_Ps1]OLL84390.1 hypothetical protein Ae263Ps1_1445c [Pseudonocardia sp. Ae263_Ps1]